MLIIDMPMPKSCARCFLADENDRCCILGTVATQKGRMQNCPIKGKLVRCGECRYYKAFDDGTFGHCKLSNGTMMKDWYCRHGERKDGADDA